MNDEELPGVVPAAGPDRWGSESVVESGAGADEPASENPWREAALWREAAAEATLVRRRVKVGGRYVAYREEADPAGQRPLVLIHGLGMSSRSFRALMPYLVDRYHVLAPDLPGCGDSDRPREALDVPQLCDTLVGWMDAVGLRDVDVAGHSLGGQICTRLAGLHEDRVRRLILIACPPDPVAPHAWQKAVRLARDGFIEPPHIVQRAVADYVRATPSMMWSTLKKSLNSDVEAYARAIVDPTLVVRGERDYVVTQAWAEELAGYIRRSRLEVIPGGTHGLPSQSPQLLAALMYDFLG